MKTKLNGLLAAFAVSQLWVNKAFAICGYPFGSPCPGGDTLVSSPEIDISAGFAAMVLAASVGALLYGKRRK